MAAPLFDLSSLDLEAAVLPDEELRECVPQDFEFRQVDAICHLDLTAGRIVGYKDWSEDAWWARGHIPGRPLMPGVLMIEGCAQTSTVLMKKSVDGWDRSMFIGLGGVDRVRFRGIVVPPCRVHYVSVVGARSSRLAKYPAQAFVDGKLVMEMELMGILL